MLKSRVPLSSSASSRCSQARRNGMYLGQLVEPTVYLYDSHERLHITGQTPNETPVQVKLYQANPVLDFYFVRAETPPAPRTPEQTAGDAIPAALSHESRVPLPAGHRHDSRYSSGEDWSARRVGCH